MKITGKQTIEIEIDNDELASAIMQWMMMRFGEIDDAGGDWGTDNGDTFIYEGNWKVSSNPYVATLVDAANIIRYGRRMIVDDYGYVVLEEQRDANAL